MGRWTIGKWTAMALAFGHLLGCSAGLPRPMADSELPLFVDRQEAPAADRARALPSINDFTIDGDTEVVGELRRARVGSGDTLLDIARRYEVGYHAIVSANPEVDVWLPKEGTEVLVPSRYLLPEAPREGVVVNVAARRLFYFQPAGEDGRQRVLTYPVAIGREGWTTPLGPTRVIAKHEQPSWRVPASIRAEHAKRGDPLPAVVPPGPGNPLGDHALRLQPSSYLIHGTNKPYGTGMRVTHGCLQLYPEHMAELYAMTGIGTPVHIVNQPYLAGRRDGVVFFEAHAPVEDHGGEGAQPRQIVRQQAGKASIDWSRVDEYARLQPAYPLPVSADSPALAAVVASAPVVTPSRTAPVTAGAPRPGWYVQAGSFHNPDNARRVVAMLGHLGPPIPARYVLAQDTHRVLAGPYASRREAEAGAARIRAELQIQAFALSVGESRAQRQAERSS